MMGIRRRTGAVGAANRLNPGASRRPGVPAVRRRTPTRARPADRRDRRSGSPGAADAAVVGRVVGEGPGLVLREQHRVAVSPASGWANGPGDRSSPCTSILPHLTAHK